MIEDYNRLQNLQSVLNLTPMAVGFVNEEANEDMNNKSSEFFGSKQKEIKELGNEKVAQEKAQKREFIRRFGAFFRGKERGGS